MGPGSPQAYPAFGKADLSNCEREQIQLAGAIQPHGAMLVLDAATTAVVQASANAETFLELGGPPLGQLLSELPGDCLQRVQPFLARDLGQIPAAVSCHVGAGGAAYDCLVHRPHERVLVLEFERAGPPADVAGALQDALQRIAAAPALGQLCDDVATVVKELTGYDRTMVYRFDDEGHGEVFAERREPHLEAFLGNRYPATDIPRIARRLYERNRVRMLSDVDSDQVPLQPRQCPVTGEELDMSLCALRSMSPIHVQYLRNMGVVGTLVASLVVGGRLWGLIACHHYEPRTLDYARRTECELLAEAVSMRIAALESFLQARAELSVRRIEQRMKEATQREGDWRVALFDSREPLLQPLRASGAALVLDGETLTVGDVPSTEDMRALVDWLEKMPTDPVFATASLGRDAPEFAALAPVASGLVACAISGSPGEYLIWLRPERVRTVVWGGNPNEAVVFGEDPNELSPRRSFAKWHELVEGTCDPWNDADLAAARLITGSVADVIQQFRSVRVLLAREQLRELQEQVRSSDQAVVICDRDGNVLLANDALTAMLPAPRAPLSRVEQLPALFVEPEAARSALEALLHTLRPWHAELAVTGRQTSARAVLVRADPVVSAQQSVLGFVIMITDISEQQAAELARQRFQEQLLDRNAISRLRLNADAGATLDKLFTAVVENAQLAALEITDGLDPTRMPAMLESVQSSVARSARLLEILLRHSAPPQGGD